MFNFFTIIFAISSIQLICVHALFRTERQQQQSGNMRPSPIITPLAVGKLIVYNASAFAPITSITLIQDGGKNILFDSGMSIDQTATNQMLNRT